MSYSSKRYLARQGIVSSREVLKCFDGGKTSRNVPLRELKERPISYGIVLDRLFWERYKKVRFID